MLSRRPLARRRPRFGAVGHLEEISTDYIFYAAQFHETGEKRRDIQGRDVLTKLLQDEGMAARAFISAGVTGWVGPSTQSLIIAARSTLFIIHSLALLSWRWGLSGRWGGTELVTQLAQPAL